MDKNQNENLFKDFHALQLFFNSDHIRLHNIHEYLKERGVFAFAGTNESIANFACNFFIGFDSQEALRKYVDVKAFPKISGFVLESENDVSLGSFRDYLKVHISEKFKIKDSTFINLNEEHGKLHGKVEYYISEPHTYNLFNTERKEATFEISKNEKSFTLKLILNRDTDYSVIHGIINNIIKNDLSIELKIIDHDLSKFITTRKRHDFFKELIEELNLEYESLGVVKYNRNKAIDLSTQDYFEDHHIKGNQEIEIMTLDELINNIEDRGALIEGVDIVLNDINLNQFFIFRLLSKDNKRRIEIGLASDVKKIDDSDFVDNFKSKSDLSKLESMNLSENEKHEILTNVWDLVSNKYYNYWNDFIKESQNL